MIYHICNRRDWETARAVGAYQADSLETEGFIHCSTKDQAVEVANRLFKGKSGLILLAIDPLAVTAEIRFENLEGGSRLFPHIYGPIPIKAVRSTVPFDADSTGVFAWPDRPDLWQLQE